MWKKLKKDLLNCFTGYCREFKLVIHDAGLILFFTFLPLAYPVIYSLIYNPELVKEVPIVVVDNDRSPLSRDMTRRIDACDEARVAGYAADLGEARHAMNSHDVYAILEIPEGFARKVGRGEQAPAVMYCDMSLLLRYRGLLVASTEVMQDMGAELMTEKINLVAPLVGTVANGDLLPINNISMGNIRNGFDSFIMPGVLILILHQCIILLMGMSGGAKHENPYLIGYDPFTGVTSTIGQMLSQTFCYITIMILPAIFMIHYVPLMFSFPMAGDLLQELAFILPMVLGCFGMGFVFQAFVKEREAVFVLWVATSLVLLLVSGLIWPRYDMVPVWRALGAVFPSTWGVEGFIKMNTNGASLAQVSSEYINLWILAVIWWGFGWCAQKFIMRPAVARLMHGYKISGPADI